MSKSMELLDLGEIFRGAERPTIIHIEGHESKPGNSNFFNFFYLINSKVIPFHIMC